MLATMAENDVVYGYHEFWATGDWFDANDPVLRVGERGNDVTRLVSKFGDGSTPWSRLPQFTFQSAYDCYLRLETLQGVPVANLKSEADWLNSMKNPSIDWDSLTAAQKAELKGPPGEQGEQGVAGKSAFQLAQDGGFTGTQAEWLESLKGEPAVNADVIDGNLPVQNSGGGGA